MPYLSLPGVDLWYEDSGGQGTPLILLHAASGTCEAWEHQVPAFTSAGYRLRFLRPTDLGAFPDHRHGTPARLCR